MSLCVSVCVRLIVLLCTGIALGSRGFIANIFGGIFILGSYGIKTGKLIGSLSQMKAAKKRLANVISSSSPSLPPSLVPHTQASPVRKEGSKRSVCVT